MPFAQILGDRSRLRSPESSHLQTAAPGDGGKLCTRSSLPSKEQELPPLVLRIVDPNTATRNGAVETRYCLGGGGVSTDIRNRTIKGFGAVGIYDDGRAQGGTRGVRVYGNVIYSSRTSATWGILTDYAGNQWDIGNNALRVGTKVGDQAIYAPGSRLVGNYAYTP